MILKYISKVLVGYKAHKTDVNRQKKKNYICDPKTNEIFRQTKKMQFKIQLKLHSICY